MPTGTHTADQPQPGRKPAIFVEWLVVGLVVVSIAGTTAAVLLFLKQGKVHQKPPEVAAKATVAPPLPVKPASVESAPAPQPPPALPDTSAEELAAIERDIKAAREAKAKADLMAWAAEVMARRLKNREQATVALSQQAAVTAAKIERDKAAIEQRASALADNVARLEMAKDTAAAKLEAAKNRKGYSIIPYRGPNGTWQRPLPIECANETAQIMPGGPSFRLIDLELSGMTRTSLFSRIVELAIRKAAAQATPDGNAPTVYVLFVVRPSGIKSYYEARARLQAQGVAFGYELVDEKTPIDYPDLGDLSEWPGFVPPQELAGQTAEPATGQGTARASGPGGFGSGSGSGSATDPGGDGLYVWKNGLDGVRPPGSGGGGMGDSATSGLGQAANGQPGLKPGGGLGGAGSPSSGTSPRVDFGPGTLSQLGRGRGGSVSRAGAGPGMGAGSPGDGLPAAQPGGPNGAVGGGTQPGGMAGTRLNLDPPYGQQADPRRPGGPAGGEPGGTFEGLMAELANQQGGSAVGRLEGRPGAVPIMPGDLADSTSPGTPGDSPFNTGSGSRPQSSSSPSAGRSPFAANPPATLPRFEPAPENGDVATGQPDQSTEENPGGIGGANGAKSAAAGQANRSAGGASAGAGRPVGGQPGGADGGDDSSKDDKQPPDRGLRAGLRRMLGGDTSLPEKAWELVLFCDADGITIRPGEHRLKLADLQGDPDLLPRTLQSMHEKHARQNPDRYWRPYIRYRVANGGDGLMGLSQQQRANGLVRWPAVWERVAAAGSAGRNQ